ncbi:nadph-dependent aldo-keto reductase [Quercus suber]|uniref:Nadph-dependent aldo-keto reductase n=1 Tax=Quercus suber TaxID=58331 RepID=A0AAW0JGE4_QUESU
MGHSVLPKSTNEARIKENFDVLDWSIPEDLFAKLSEIEQASTLFLYIHLDLVFDFFQHHYEYKMTHNFLPLVFAMLGVKSYVIPSFSKCFDQNLMCKMDLWII